MVLVCHLVICPDGSRSKVCTHQLYSRRTFWRQTLLAVTKNNNTRCTKTFGRICVQGICLPWSSGWTLNSLRFVVLFLFSTINWPILNDHSSIHFAFFSSTIIIHPLTAQCLRPGSRVTSRSPRSDRPSQAKRANCFRTASKVNWMSWNTKSKPTSATSNHRPHSKYPQ